MFIQILYLKKKLLVNFLIKEKLYKNNLKYLKILIIKKKDIFQMFLIKKIITLFQLIKKSIGCL
jgi:hypothetical protein